MNLLCKVLGHIGPMEAEKGWWSPGQEYAKVSVGATDNVGRTHCIAWYECERCNSTVQVCRFHLPKPESDAGLECEDTQRKEFYKWASDKSYDMSVRILTGLWK